MMINIQSTLYKSDYFYSKIRCADSIFLKITIFTMNGLILNSKHILVFQERKAKYREMEHDL